MKEEFVTYEQALALKELGFDEPCFGWYNYGTFQMFDSDSILDMYAGEENRPLAPLKQQVFKWFREKYDLRGCINPYFQFEIGVGSKNKTRIGNPPEGVSMYVLGETFMEIYSKEYDTHEEAESACIDKLIEIVKNK